jgi:CRP/FNR family transcriptional regulator
LPKPTPGWLNWPPGRADVKTRVARLLLRLSSELEPGLAIRLSLEDIGAVLGVAPESASRALGILRRSKMLFDAPDDRHYWQINVSGLNALVALPDED